MKKTEWTMGTLDNRSAFMRNIASNTTIKHKNTITESVLDKIRAEIEEVDMNITYQENKDRKASWGLRKALEIIDKYRESEG